MPIGNGSLLANVWTEKGGDVCVSLARYSRSDDSAKKIGTLRFQFDPGLNTSRDSFRQMLRFKYGEVVVKNSNNCTGDREDGGGGNILSMQVNVSANVKSNRSRGTCRRHFKSLRATISFLSCTRCF